MRLLPEWAPQEAVLLAWPDEQTDWAPWLADVRQTYIDLIEQINAAGCGVILLVRQGQVASCQQTLAGKSVLMLPADYNDTWLRDYGFLTCDDNGIRRPVEFTFNGWGNKFDARKDNQINQSLFSKLCQHSLTTFPQVAEGGALEIDQHGVLLSTKLCLTNPERNGDMSLNEYEALFSQSLGAEKTVVFEHGHLEGDDTDGHVDTLVRYTPDSGLVIQGCENRPSDSHYAGLSALVEECRQRLPEHRIYTLPLPEIYNQDGERLPASYANYLIVNDRVLCPVYQTNEDEQALAVIAQAYPQHTIVAINSLPLIQQFGSVHCISMQVPTGTLKSDVVSQLNSGVNIYE